MRELASLRLANATRGACNCILGGTVNNGDYKGKFRKWAKGRRVETRLALLHYRAVFGGTRHEMCLRY